MTIYQILGIAEDASKKAIKQAYAKKVKQLDLSKEIDEYQELRKAYELALSIQAHQEVSPIADVDTREMVVEEIIEINDRVTDDQVTVVYPEDFNSQLRALIEQEAYFNDAVLWENLLKPYLNGSLQAYEETRQRMVHYLIENHYLLSFEVKAHITSLCELTEEDWYAYFGHHDYQALLADNHLRFDGYENLLIEQRETYYYYRYLLYRYLFQGEGEASIHSVAEKAKAFSYLDDDLLYLMALYYLGQSKEGIRDSHTLIVNLLSRIKGSRYRHDCDLLAQLTQSFTSSDISKLSYTEIKGLEWAPDRLKRYWVSLLYPNKATKTVNLYEPSKRKNSWVFGWVALIVVGVIFKLGLNGSHQSNVPVKKIDQQIIQRIQNETMIDNTKVFRELRRGKQFLFFDDLFQNESSELRDSELKEEFSEDGYQSYLLLKATNQDQLEQLKHNSGLDRESSHDFQAHGSLVRVQFTSLPDWILEVRLNWEEEITNIVFQPSGETQGGPSLGSYAAYDYFRSDLRQYGRSDHYLKVMEVLGQDYVTEELRSEMALMAEDQEKLDEVIDFVNQEGSVLSDTPLVLGFKKNEEVLFIEFNEQGKMAHFYGGSFTAPSEDYLEAVKDASFDFH